MTREEALAWAKSLKPGDTVIHRECRRVCALTVEKVTPTGIVKTNDDKCFAQNSWVGCIVGRGRTGGEIVPATPELLEEAEKQQKERDEEEKRVRTINRAIIKKGHMPRMTYEFAVDFLELCKKHGIE